MRPTMVAARSSMPMISKNLFANQMPLMQFGFTLKINKSPLQTDLDFLKASLPQPQMRIDAPPTNEVAAA